MSHFRRQAAEYAQYRPDYPDVLFETVAALCRQRKLALDCATGNGQAAHSLADHFERVVATDISPEQIAHARLRENIEYRVTDASSSGLPGDCCDLVSIFQALHWVDLPKFYAEVSRVLRPGGIFVAGLYSDAVIPNDPRADAVLQHFSKVTVGKYWPRGRALVDKLFEMPFPFEEIRLRDFELTREWDLHELAGYLRSWSASTRYAEAHGSDPVLVFESEIAPHWPDASIKKRIEWPFQVRAGRKR